MKSAQPPSPQPTRGISFHAFQLDGFEALTAVISGSPFKTLENAVAALSIFSHPETVKQTAFQPLVRTVRMRSFGQRGSVGELNGQKVGFDDNKSPTDAFLWCNEISRKRDVQFNHIYPLSNDPQSYTCLANICMSPAFIAKLTDTHKHVRRLLEFRSFELYGWHPPGHVAPTAPPGYERLAWADPLPPVSNLSAKLERVLERRPKDRTVQFMQQLGWAFSNPPFKPTAKTTEQRDNTALIVEGGA